LQAIAFSGRFTAEKFVLFLAPAAGAAQAAEQQYADSHGNEYREESSKRK
jgi:hypothetical protein